MRCRRSVVFCTLLLGCFLVAAGKDKKKAVLPEDVLEARTVLVVIDPDAGVPLRLPTQT